MSESHFPEGMLACFIIAFGILFLVLKSNDNQADYWRGAFCIEARNPPECCKEVLDD